MRLPLAEGLCPKCHLRKQEVTHERRWGESKAEIGDMQLQARASPSGRVLGGSIA